MLNNKTRKTLEGTINYNYPHDNLVFWKSKNGNYDYTIINLDSLPPKPNLKYTQHPGQYPIPNKYQIEAFWGHNKKNHIQTSIDYVEGIPYFKIEWIQNEQNCVVVSQISPSDASNKYCNIRYPERKTAISGILMFGLQLYEELTKAMPKKNQP